MKTFKLGEFESPVNDLPDEAVYVFRLGRRIYYVGATERFGERMKGHISKAAKWTQQPVAIAMSKSRGAWRRWEVEVYSVEECAAIFGDIMNVPLAKPVFVAEEKMMNRLKPRLNVVWPRDFSWHGLDGKSAHVLKAWHRGDRMFARQYARMQLHQHMIDTVKNLVTGDSIIGD